MPRTAGFNSIDVAALEPETLLFTDVLMFIGGGSAGTAGGIKVTTFGLLAYVLWAEMRGDPDVDVGRRRVPAGDPTTGPGRGPPRYRVGHVLPRSCCWR